MHWLPDPSATHYLREVCSSHEEKKKKHTNFDYSLLQYHRLSEERAIVYKLSWEHKQSSWAQAVYMLCPWIPPKMLNPWGQIFMWSIITETRFQPLHMPTSFALHSNFFPNSLTTHAVCVRWFPAIRLIFAKLNITSSESSDILSKILKK